MSADNWTTCSFCGQETWREDYEIYGAETGQLTIDYSGGCYTYYENGCGKEFHKTWNIDLIKEIG